jgi:hypothetical protein
MGGLVVVAVALRERSPIVALALIERLLAESDQFSPEFEKIDLGELASVHVYLPEPDFESAITPQFMEAFLVLQKQIYQLAALATAGVADVGQLGEADRRDLQINVVVTGGSSNYFAQLKEPLEALLKRMVGKMTGKQAAVVIVCLSTLVAGSWSFSAWLDQTKAVKLEELKSKDHVTALQAIQFSNEEQSKAFNRIIDILGQQGDAGKRALNVVQATNEALLKAAAQNPKTIINDVEVTRQEAELLRVPARKRAETKIVIQQVKVVDINTTDPLDLQIVLMEPVTLAQHRIKFKDSLFAGADRHVLFEALENRKAIWVELAVKEIEGEIRSVQLLRTREAPDNLVSEAEADD